MPGRTPAPTVDERHARDVSLRTAARETKKAAEKLSMRDAAIRMAYRTGASLREISTATELPTMTVKRIIDRLERPDRAEA